MFICNILILFIIFFINNFRRGEKVVFCFLLNICFGIVIRIIVKFESLEVGLIWSRVGRFFFFDDDFSFVYVFVMFIV